MTVYEHTADRMMLTHITPELYERLGFEEAPPDEHILTLKLTVQSPLGLPML